MRHLCKMTGVHPNGFYAWCLQPESRRVKEDKRLLGHIKQSWLESGAVYGYRKVSDDLRDPGERCGINRVHRIMCSAGLRSQTGYGKRTVHHRWWRQIICSGNLTCLNQTRSG